MGLFSKKPKEIVYDRQDCELKKQAMRNIFNSTVSNGDEYEILYAYMTSSKYERGFIFDCNTTSFYYYILGYRLSDLSIVLVQVDSNLNEHSEAYYLDMNKICDVSYNPKYYQLCLNYPKDYERYGEILNISSSTSTTKYGPKNIYQEDEIEAFLDFCEKLRAKLERQGLKLEKWKRK